MRTEEVKKRLDDIREIADRLKNKDIGISGYDWAAVENLTKYLVCLYGDAKASGEIYISNVRKPLNRLRYELLRIERENDRINAQREKDLQELLLKIKKD